MWEDGNIDRVRAEEDLGLNSHLTFVHSHKDRVLCGRLKCHRFQLLR